MKAEWVLTPSEYGLQEAEGNITGQEFMAKIFFISDLHLQESEPEITEIFLRFLRGQAHEAEALYILGDLFEVWVGDDDLSAFNVQIIQALKQATQRGLPIYFMRGNRDFFIGRKFAKKTGVKIIADPTLIDLYGVPTVLMHGDSLCTFDLKHQKTRRYTSNSFYKWVVLQLPLSLRRRAGVWLRGKSQGHQKHTENYIMDVNPETVNQVMQEHQATQLIHGHTHKPKIHTLEWGQRIVLGAWHHTGNVLICDASQGCELHTLN